MDRKATESFVPRSNLRLENTPTVGFTALASPKVSVWSLHRGSKEH